MPGTLKYASDNFPAFDAHDLSRDHTKMFIQASPFLATPSPLLPDRSLETTAEPYDLQAVHTCANIQCF